MVEGPSFGKGAAKRNRHEIPANHGLGRDSTEYGRRARNKNLAASVHYDGK